MAGAVNSTETDGESPSGNAPPSVDLASLRSSLSSADSDNPPRSLRAIASSFDEAHASTSAARFRAECALCALLDDPRRPLDAPARLAALFVLARGGEALGADDGSGSPFVAPDAPDSPSPFAETLRFWASGFPTFRTFRGEEHQRLAAGARHEHRSPLVTAERTFLRALSDPAKRARIADAAPETWLREKKKKEGDVDPCVDDNVDEQSRSFESRSETTRKTLFGLWSREEADETGPIGAPFVARAFDAERFWFAPRRRGNAEFSLKKNDRPLWDKTAGLPRLDASFAARLEARAILEESFKVPVAPMRQSTASAALRRDASLAHVVARSADAFRETVEKNPPVAASVLLATARVPSARVARLPTLLDVLLENVGVHAMEVVAKAFEESREFFARNGNGAGAFFCSATETDGNETRDSAAETETREKRKTSSYPLPASFLTPFAARCVRRCVDGGEGGVGSSRSQHASARLTCMFLQVLLRERHVSVADLPAEVESFCVEFMSVKEAADLFRLVKQLQREDARAANGLIEDAEGGVG